MRWLLAPVAVVLGLALAVPARANGPWGPPQRVSADGGGLPALSVNDRGQGLLAFEGSYPFFGAFRRRLQVAWAAAGSDRFGPPLTIWSGSRDTNLAGAPNALLSNAGEAVVSFQDEDFKPLYSIKHPGGRFEPPRGFKGMTAGVPGLSADSRGNMAALTVARNNAQPGHDTLLVAWRRAGEAEFGSARELVEGSLGGDVRLVFVENDIPVLIFTAVPKGSPPSAHVLVFAAVGSFGGAFGLPVVISNPAVDGPRGAGDFEATTSRRGDLLVAWTSGVAGRGNYFALRRPRQSFQAPVRFAEGYSVVAGPALDRDGRAAAAWYSFSPGANLPSDPGTPVIATLGPTDRSLRRVQAPPRLRPGPPIAFDAFGTAQFEGQTLDDPPAPGSWSLLRDGTFGAGDRIAPPGWGFTGDSSLGFDGIGGGWIAWTVVQGGVRQVVAAPYDGRLVSARRRPEIRWARIGKPIFRSAARGRRKPEFRTSLLAVLVSKTSRLSVSVKALRLPRRCRKPKRKRLKAACHRARRTVKLERRLQPGSAQIKLRFHRGRRYRAVLTARDSLGQRSKPKKLRFRG